MAGKPMMERTLGLRSAVAMMVGIVIGSGIFASPGFVLAAVGSPGGTLLVWFVCGMMTLAGSVSMAELSAALPLSGGESVYLTRAFHPLVGFYYTWVTALLAKPCGQALIALVFADYLCRLPWDCSVDADLLPDLEEALCESPPPWTRKAIALGAIWFLATMQTISTKAATMTQDVFTAIKLLLIFALIVIGLYEAATIGAINNTTSNLKPENSFKNTADDPKDWALALANCLFAYNGWNNLNLSAGEVKNAATTIPKAAIIGLPLIMACYVWLNISYFLVLPLEAISGAETVAVDFAEEFGGRTAGRIVAVGVALSAFGALNGSLFGAARLVHACGMDGTLPSFFAGSLSPCGKTTPVVGTVLQAAIASTLVAAVGSFSIIVKIYIFAQWLFYLLTMIGLLWLRKSAPEMERPFIVPAVVPVLFVLSAAFVVVVLLWDSLVECSISLALLVVGTPVYFLQRKAKFQIQGQILVEETKALLDNHKEDQTKRPTSRFSDYVIVTG